MSKEETLSKVSGLEIQTLIEYYPWALRAMDEYSSSLKGEVERLREALVKYGQHLPTCNIKQDWSEALDAMANTPTKFRDHGYDKALEELKEKQNTCTCGLETSLQSEDETITKQ